VTRQKTPSALESGQGCSRPCSGNPEKELPQEKNCPVGGDVLNPLIILGRNRSEISPKKVSPKGSFEAKPFQKKEEGFKLPRLYVKREPFERRKQKGETFLTNFLGSK